MKLIYEKVQTVSTQLTWNHYSLLVSFDINKINYYIKISITENLSVRQLREKIKNNEYERLDEKTKLKLISKEQIKVNDLIKNSIIIKNLNNYEIVSEKVLQKLILENIPNFLKELGSCFTFIENEYKIRIGNTFNYIDFLLYNIKFKCYVVIELKITKFKKRTHWTN